MKLAYGSSASDMVQRTKQLTQIVSTGYFQFQSQYGATPSASGLPGVLQSVTPLGTWLYQARTTLQNLTQLSQPGAAQTDKG